VTELLCLINDVSFVITNNVSVTSICDSLHIPNSIKELTFPYQDYYSIFKIHKYNLNAIPKPFSKEEIEEIDYHSNRIYNEYKQYFKSLDYIKNIDNLDERINLFSKFDKALNDEELMLLELINDF
jgi:hypothetical protein